MDCPACERLSAIFHEPKCCNEHLPRCRWCQNPEHAPDVCLAEMTAALRTMTNALLWITDQSDAGRLDGIERLHKHDTVIETARDLLARIDGASRSEPVTP